MSSWYEAQDCYDDLTRIAIEDVPLENLVRGHRSFYILFVREEPAVYVTWTPTECYRMGPGNRSFHKLCKQEGFAYSPSTAIKPVHKVIQKTFPKCYSFEDVTDFV